MHPHHDFHRSFAQDRQSQLRRSAGVDLRSAPQLAEIAADRRAEAAENRQQAHRLNVAARLEVALAAPRRLVRMGSRLSGA